TTPIAEAFTLTEAWEPGTDLDLGLTTRRSSGERRTLITDYLGRFKPAAAVNSYRGPGVIDTEGEKGRYLEHLMALAFFSQLEPPVPGDGNAQYAAQRAATHGWDLSLWFTHPCVIVVGYIDNG